MLKCSDRITLLSCRSDRPIAPVCVLCVDVSPSVRSRSTKRESEELEGAGRQSRGGGRMQTSATAEDRSICADSLRCLQQTFRPGKFVVVVVVLSSLQSVCKVSARTRATNRPLLTGLASASGI